jgi:NADH:ubiquinone oxidoreductase subunit E
VTPALLRRTAWAAGVLIFAGIAVLFADWGIAAKRAPQNDQIIKTLQTQVQKDAAVAHTLEAEQKRITDARLARRTRDRAIGWGLVVFSAFFLASVKRLIALEGRKAVDKSTITAEAATAGKKRRRKNKNITTVPAKPAAAPLDMSFVDQVVAQLGGGKEAAIPLLQAIQQHYRYLPEEALQRLCEITQITQAEIVGTSSFYGQFRRSPVGRHIVRVCHGTACHVTGARQISDELRRSLKIQEGADTDADRMFTLEEVACLGCCSLAPVMMVDEHTAGRLTPSTASAALDDVEQKELS